MKICHASGLSPAWYGNERDPRDTCTDHADGYHPPRRLSTGAEKSIVAATALAERTLRDIEQNQKINSKGGYHEKGRVHREKMNVYGEVMWV